MKKILIVAFALLLQSCASVPLATMLSLSQFGPDDFLAIQPEQLRTKIVLTDPFRPALDATTLNLMLTTPKGMRNYPFDLEQVAEFEIAAVDGLLFDTPAKTEFVYRLSPAAVENFKQVQHEFSNAQANNENNKYKITIETGFAGSSEGIDVDDLTLSILIQFEENQEFMLLIDEATIEVAK